VVGFEIDNGALMDTWSRRSRWDSKCFSNVTGISDTISRYLPAATVASFAVLFTTSCLLESSSLHVTHHGILDETGNLFNQNLG
jgi:hypothetical protein